MPNKFYFDQATQRWRCEGEEDNEEYYGSHASMPARPPPAPAPHALISAAVPGGYTARLARR